MPTSPRTSALSDRFTPEGGDRHAFMAGMARLAGGAAAAELLVAAEDDARVAGAPLSWKAGDGRAIAGYSSTPRDEARPATIFRL